MIVKVTRRYAANLMVDASYVFSKIITDSDTAWGNGSFAADQFNRRLEKSIGAFDVTHDFKFAATYDLPFGKGRQYATNMPKVAELLLGGWQTGMILTVQDGDAPKTAPGYTIYACQNGNAWQWANAEPAVPRWGNLQ